MDNKTEQELREKLCELLDNKSFQLLSIADQAHQILARIKEAGYVKLAKSQSIPEKVKAKFRYKSLADFDAGQLSLIHNGWRRVVEVKDGL